MAPRISTLTRPEGSQPEDFHLSRRGVAGLMFSGYAAYALAAEAEPIHTDEIGLVTADITVAEASESLPAYVARPAGRGRFPAIIVVSEVFGIHDYIRDICRRFAKLGYVAIAPAFFFRADPTNTLATTSDFAVIQKIVATAHNDQVMGDVGAALTWLEAQPFVDKKRLAITGYCWGGAVVWMAVDKYPALKAGIAWYGRLSPPKPGQFMADDKRKWPLELAGELHTPVLGLYGGLDKGIPPEDIEAMRAQLKAAGQTDDQLIVYPDAQHGFHADYRASYNKTAAEDGWARMLAFLRAEHVEPGAKHGCSADPGMSALRFDLDVLRERLGEKRFKRAEGYAERGWVRIIAVENRRVSALITGERGDTYGVEADETGDGLCTCPDFAETRACKHMGALALAADGLEPTQTRLLNGRFARLRETLAFEDAPALTEVILNLARRLPGVLEALEGEEE